MSMNLLFVSILTVLALKPNYDGNNETMATDVPASGAVQYWVLKRKPDWGIFQLPT